MGLSRRGGPGQGQGRLLFLGRRLVRGLLGRSEKTDFKRSDEGLTRQHWMGGIPGQHEAASVPCRNGRSVEQRPSLYFGCFAGVLLGTPSK
jgi:hypothetical protein